MRIYRLTDLSKALDMIRNQATKSLESDKPVDVCCVEVKKIRTIQQNKYLFELYTNLLDFYHQTGFMIDGLNKQVKFINKDLLHEYIKARFDVKTTTKMTTKEFAEFVDTIQNEWIEQSVGEYEYFFPTVDLIKLGHSEGDISC